MFVPALMRSAPPPSSVGDSMAAIVERFATRIELDVELGRVVLPSVPATVLRVRELLQDERATMKDVCDGISSDPALATRVIKMANSASFGGISTCNSVQTAVVRLGNAVVENVVLILTVSRVFNVGGRAVIQPHLAQLWQHSALVGALSDLLSAQIPHLQREVAMLGGLIHDIGVVPVLVQAQKYPTLLSNPVLLETLVSALHTRLGGAVLESWNMPPELSTVVAGHEDLQRDEPGPVDYTDVVIAANLIAHLEDACSERDHWSLPVCRKLGIEARDAAELLAEARAAGSALMDLVGEG